MGSFEFLFSLLECPSCRSSLDFTPIEQPQLPERIFGILSCTCNKYPVIDGIPIFLKRPIGVQAHVSGATQMTGPTPDVLISLILQRKGLEALLRLITFPWCPQSFKRFRLLKSLTQRNPFRGISLRLRKAILRQWITDPSNSLTAEDWFFLFYRRSLMYGDLFSYFFFRSTQPRHLAALSLMTTLPRYDQPLLDLACGFAHLAQYLTECEKAYQVVALDRNFFQLWVAKYWMAPKAHYLCGDADSPLPFKNAALGGILCSDAFHLLGNKRECLDEMRRCAPDGTIILTRVGNQLVEPNEGKELSPEQYLELFNTAKCQLIGEAELTESYLLGFGPRLLVPAEPESLHKEKWLSIVLSNDPTVLTDHGKFETWPHGVGHLGLNPIYRRSRSGPNGSLQLSFQFPSSWFAFENAKMESYHPHTVNIDREVYDQIRHNLRTQPVNDLISQFVVLGMPQRYSRLQL